jgi:hypothetical protein
LSRANDNTHRHNAKRRFQVSLKPSRLICVHGVKYIVSCGESKAKDVSGAYAWSFPEASKKVAMRAAVLGSRFLISS